MTVPKFDSPSGVADRLRQHARYAGRQLGRAGFTAAVGVATHTIFPMLRARFRRQNANGEPVILDDAPGPPPTQDLSHLRVEPADLSPRPGPHRKARHMKLEAYPDTTYGFAYRQPPVSGNVINGVGEAERRRPHHVFFGDGYGRAWGKLDWFFQVMEPTHVHRQIAAMFWQDRRRVGPVAMRSETFEPAEAARRVKAIASAAGASLVGICDMAEELCFDDFDGRFRHAIAVGMPMDREAMLHTPSDRSGHEIMRTYTEINRIAIEVAEAIRAMGYPARAATNIPPEGDEVLHVPIALRSGLGQLGKHGSLITLEHGSNVRLAAVLTDLPMEVDEPVDIGVEDFCAHCHICEDNCPPRAITSDKKLVRGDTKFYVDFDACAPYFAKTAGCGICIEVCPWSEPGRGPRMRDKIMAKRARSASASVAP